MYIISNDTPKNPILDDDYYRSGTVSLGNFGYIPGVLFGDNLDAGISYINVCECSGHPAGAVCTCGKSTCTCNEPPPYRPSSSAPY